MPPPAVHTGRMTRGPRATRRPAPAPALHESAVRTPGRLTVDRDAGVIRGVKVLGWDSKNGRRYDPAGVDPALYEGADVNIDHAALKNPGGRLETTDRFG